MTHHRFLRVCTLACAVAVAPSAAAAQPAASRLDRPLRVFIDCRGPGCDETFFRSELTWIDHVRDQGDADLHLLVTSQDTGGGGEEFTIRLIGRGRWDGRDDALTLATEAGETDDVMRRSLARTFSLLLARYAAETPVGPLLTVESPGEAVVQTGPAEDRWNYWVFRINVNSSLDAERSDRESDVELNMSANRTTDAWKVNVETEFEYSENRFALSDGIFRTYRRSRRLNALVVKSLTEHWSAGGMMRLSRSTFENQRLNLRLAPGIEYNFFPYGESTSRQMTVQWTAGINRFRYDEETIFGRLNESLWDQQLLAILSLRQPYGTIQLTGEAAHFLEDVSKYRYSVMVDTEIRLFRGFSFNVDGDYTVLHDQLYLPREGATDEEIIARQRQLETSFRYNVFLGITYRFGSINNNVVNQRFGGG